MSLTSSDYLEPGFHELELGDTVIVPDLPTDTVGWVVSIHPHLVILWDDGLWEYATDWREDRVERGWPYRVQRRDWDLDIESIHDAVYFGTDLEPAV